MSAIEKHWTKGEKSCYASMSVYLFNYSLQERKTAFRHIRNSSWANCLSPFLHNSYLHEYESSGRVQSCCRDDKGPRCCLFQMLRSYDLDPQNKDRNLENPRIENGMWDPYHYYCAAFAWIAVMYWVMRVLTLFWAFQIYSFKYKREKVRSSEWLLNGTPYLLAFLIKLSIGATKTWREQGTFVPNANLSKHSQKACDTDMLGLYHCRMQVGFVWLTSASRFQKSWL